MPRKDPTYSSGDVIRIWRNHLTSDEKVVVVMYFYFIVPSLFWFQTVIIGKIARKLKKILPESLHPSVDKLLNIQKKAVKALPDEVVITLIEDDAVIKQIIMKKGDIMVVNKKLVLTSGPE